jgi:hypothetical protein
MHQHHIFNCRVNLGGGGTPKIRVLGQGNNYVWPHILGMSPTCGFTHCKAWGEVYMNLNISRSWGSGGGGFLHILLKS